VTDMGGMFCGAATFNQPLGTWDVSGVTDMGGMFCGAATFNQPLGTWDVSSVTDMNQMFLGASSSHTQSLREWNVEKVIRWSFSHTLCGVADMFDSDGLFFSNALHWKFHPRLLESRAGHVHSLLRQRERRNVERAHVTLIHSLLEREDSPAASVFGNVDLIRLIIPFI
jgi:surface protein